MAACFTDGSAKGFVISEAMGKAQAGPQGGFALGCRPGELAANRGSQAGPWTQSARRPSVPVTRGREGLLSSGSSPRAVVALPLEAGHMAPLNAGGGRWSRHSPAAICC